MPVAKYIVTLSLILFTLTACNNPTNSDSPRKVSTMKSDTRLTVNIRSQKQTDNKTWQQVTKTESWDPKRTAIIICDMWDDHWCKGAANRVVELAKPMNDIVNTARNKGMLIIHAPSSVTSFYKDTPQRAAATSAPFVKTKTPLAKEQRWGTAWCWPDKNREADLPIDDMDMGCDCAKKCTIREAWTRQINTIEIKDGDAITDNGQETINLLAQHKIDHIIIMGVHLNMCVLGRPFGIRQMVTQGKQIVLMRDMTDTMYNHEMKPFVNHFQGTDLVINHVEQYWCPTITSSDLTGKPPFKFKEDKR